MEQIIKIPFIQQKAAPIPLSFFEERTYEKNGFTLPYRFHLPTGYSADKAYPVILFLHGAGERGEDNTAQLKIGIGQLFADPDSPIHQCIVIAPQCPVQLQWVSVSSWKDTQYSTEEIPESLPLDTAHALLLDVIKRYAADTDRIYCTGISMGGFGTWDLLVRHTELFAAAIPLCGGADNRFAARLANVPIYTFHGDADDVVPPEGTQCMTDKLIALGNEKLRVTYYLGGTHGIWENAYATDGLLEWLLSHRRSDRA